MRAIPTSRISRLAYGDLTLAERVDELFEASWLYGVDEEWINKAWPMPTRRLDADYLWSLTSESLTMSGASVPTPDWFRAGMTPPVADRH